MPYLIQILQSYKIYCSLGNYTMAMKEMINSSWVKSFSTSFWNNESVIISIAGT